MKTQDTTHPLSWDNARNHFLTISRHKLLVMKYCFRCGLYRQGLLHDLSKYTPAEFLRGVRYYQGFRSPNDEERASTGMSRAWMHHKGRNRHHFEYWIDYKIGGDRNRFYGVPMPNRYIVEMFCDRVAAGKIYAGESFTDAMPLAYFKKGCTVPLMHPDTARKIEQLLVLYRDHGEEAFTMIRKLSHRDAPLWERMKMGEKE